MLIDAFGSRKKQKDMRSKEANVVDVTNVVGVEAVAAQLAESGAQVQADTAAAIAADGGGSDAAAQDSMMATRLQYLPPLNQNASNPKVRLRLKCGFAFSPTDTVIECVPRRWHYLSGNWQGDQRDRWRHLEDCQVAG